MSKKTKPAGIPWDYAASHGPVTGPMAAALAASSVAMTGTLADLPNGWPLLVGVAGAAVHGIGHSIRAGLSRFTASVRAASWLAAGGWTSYVIAADPRTWEAGEWGASAALLAALAVLMGAGAYRADVHEEAREENQLADQRAQARAHMTRQAREIAERWTQLIALVCRVDLVSPYVELWENGRGFSYQASMPTDGKDTADLQSYARRLAQAARLPAGCTVEFGTPEIQGDVILDVTTTPRTEGDVHEWGDDFSPKSLLDGIFWGDARDGEEIKVFLREADALILGPPGSGKSVLTNGTMVEFARCVDVLTFAIDLKSENGALPRPWLRPWLEAQGFASTAEGRTRPPADTRPGVDWAATNPREALRMIEACHRIAAARQRAYQDLLDREDVDLLPISAQVPQIEIVIDEGAIILGYDGQDKTRLKLKDRLRDLKGETRAMGIRVVITNLDGNVSYLGGTDVKKFSPVRAGMLHGDRDLTNTDKLFGRVKGVDLKQVKELGAALVGAETDPGALDPQVMVTRKVTPATIRAAVLATNTSRPALDEISADAAGDDYKGRWNRDRLGWLLDNGNEDQDQADGGEEQESTAPRRGLNLRTRSAGEAAPASAAQDAERERIAAQFADLMKKEFPAASGTDAADAADLSKTSSVSGSGDADGEDQEGGDDWRRAVHAVLAADSGEWLAMKSVLAGLADAGHEVRSETVSRYLADQVRKGTVAKKGMGNQTRYRSTPHNEPS